MKSEPCVCCFLRFAPERFSPTDKRPQICVGCSHHQGDTNAAKRDREHLRDWRASYAAAMASNESRLANMRKLLDAADEREAELGSKLSDALEAISSDYHKAPIGDLHNALETALVTEAEKKAESAFRVRSRAMAVLWRIDRLHNTVDGKSTDVCKCGEPADRCGVLLALLPFTEELGKWEAREKERMYAGKAHGLPAEHPDARKYMQMPGSFWQGPGRYPYYADPYSVGRRF